MDQTFPWLSQLAMSFAQYKWRGLVFTYKTTSSDLVTSTNPSLGTVMMATDYNAAEEPFVDKRSMASYEFTTSSKPSLSFVHGIECEKQQTAEHMFYVRDGPPKDNGDIRLYDIGSFSIATQGMQSTDPNATIGELWVAYEIEFFKPRFDIDAGLEFDRFEIEIPSEVWPIGNQSQLTLISGNLGGRLSASDDVLPWTTPGQTWRYYFPPDASGKIFNIELVQDLQSVSSSVVTAHDVNAGRHVQIGDKLWNAGIDMHNPVLTASNVLWMTRYVKVGQIPSSNSPAYIEFKLISPIASAIPSGALRHKYITVKEVNEQITKDIRWKTL